MWIVREVALGSAQLPSWSACQSLASSPKSEPASTSPEKPWSNRAAKAPGSANVSENCVPPPDGAVVAGEVEAGGVVVVGGRVVVGAAVVVVGRTVVGAAVGGTVVGGSVLGGVVGATVVVVAGRVV